MADVMMSWHDTVPTKYSTVDTVLYPTGTVPVAIQRILFVTFWEPPASIDHPFVRSEPIAALLKEQDQRCTPSSLLHHPIDNRPAHSYHKQRLRTNEKRHNKTSNLESSEHPALLLLAITTTTTADPPSWLFLYWTTCIGKFRYVQ